MGSLRCLWATPRTVSTAFERMVIERGDLVVLDEPWSRAYYFGPHRRSDRYPLVFPESTDAAVESSVLTLAEDHDVFVKDMAYQAHPGCSDELLRVASHTFLVREPKAALASLEARWPDATDDEAGFVAQQELYDRVLDVGADAVVVDSDRLRRDPQGVVGRWCAAVGLPERPDALTWSPGMRPEWQLWTDWYEGVARSTGFAPPAPSSTVELGPLGQRLLGRAEQVYARFERSAL